MPHVAWDEWEQLKSEAVERGATHMRLNQLAPDGGGGGGSGDLVVRQDDLGAVGHEAYILYGDVKVLKPGRPGEAAMKSLISAYTTALKKQEPCRLGL
jgi:hypothetical protein